MEKIISINQLAAALNLSEKARKRILKQQKEPNKLLIPWYQKAKSSIKKYLEQDFDKSILSDAEAQLSMKICSNKRQITDRAVSIEALRIVREVRVPRILKASKITKLKLADKAISLNGVIVKIAPDFVFEVDIAGQKAIGAVKIHVCKGDPFDFEQAKLVSSAIYLLLKKASSKSGLKVLPELCLCLDVFSERIVSAPSDLNAETKKIKGLLAELKHIWPAA